MGLEAKKSSVPPLPAPTETDSTTATELATDVDKPADEKSSYSLPEDGTPVTIKTRHKANRSQTSLLIEYFEGGKTGPSASGGERKPSVRVRLTPSKNRKDDRIQITETKSSSRKASLSRRSAPLTPSTIRAEGEALSALSDDAKSMSSYASATEESNVSRNPIEVEIDRGGHHRRRRPASPLIPTADTSKASYQPGTMSEISAIPTDSFLDGSGPTKTPEGRRSRSPSRAGDILTGAAAGLAAAAAADKLRSKSRSEKERIVIPKSKDREKSDRKHRSSKSRTSSVSEKDGVKSPRRRSSRTRQESELSAVDSSVMSSGLSPSHRSADQHSIRSGTSKSSINNPKLLETVEDAIRRLILPELNALKREQSRKDRRSSAASSGTSASRDEYASDRRRSGASERPAASSKENVAKIRDRRDREARHDVEDSPAHSTDHVSVESVREMERTPKHSSDNLKAAVAGAAVGALGAAIMQDRSPTAREQRRRRRAEAKTRGSERFLEEQDSTEYLAPAPPMPLMSEINPSEVTRTSILSAETDRPQSASEELTPVPGAGRDVVSPESSPTPTRTPATTLQGLGAQHVNISHGDLRALPRTGTAEYTGEGVLESDGYGQQVPMHPHEEYDEYDETVHEPVDMSYDQAGYDYYNTQVVPAPLKYVPYQPERRGLSPIPSVSGYTEGGSEVQASRDSRVTTTTTSSHEKSPQHDRAPQSPNSIPSNVVSRDFDQDDRSLRSSGVDYRNTQYTDDSEMDPVTSGQAVRGVGANPDIVHSPFGVESAVASLVDGSMLEDSVLTGEPGYVGRDLHAPRGSMDTLEEERFQSHATPSRRSVESHGHLAAEHEVARASPTTTRTNPSEFADEYDLDQYGRKVQRSRYRQSPTVSEAAITARAVDLAIQSAKDRNRPSALEEDTHAEEWTSDGIPQRNKSFKEHTMDGRRPANTPSHSVDNLDAYERPKMGVSGIPDLSDPLPEIGFGYGDDLITNPSVVDGDLDGEHHEAGDAWPGDRTPTRHQPEQFQQEQFEEQDAHYRAGGHGLSLSEAAGAAAIATAAALASSHHSRQPSQEQDEEWQRTSDDRKRDTLITNPYQGESPIVNNLPNVDETLLKSTLAGAGYGGQFSTRSPLGPKVDEGYISQGPNKTPDIQQVKGKGVEFSDQPNLAADDDPFYTPVHTRHLSGMSQGMGSPLYDASTGMGIDRIENKDIVALMQHLMVRDAQRSARDTEILVTLIKSATEMRDSFENMKKMVDLQGKGLTAELRERIADTEDVIITEVKENTEKTVRHHIGGPRPFPGSGARSLQATSQADTEDGPARSRNNFFRRALKGLSAKGNNDLGRIEDMLMQLLTEVDTLKGQAGPGGGGSNRAQSFDNMEPEIQYEQDRGYEPEGHAGTSTASHASQSGHLSLNSRVPSSKLGYERKFSDHRISTVPEANEEEADHQDAHLKAHFSNPDMLAPPHEPRRGSSMPLATPPQAQTAQQTSLSNENTPRTDKGKKHKSSGSASWLPKISRWSGTTTSSVGRVFRSSKDSRKDQDQDLGEFHSNPSRSGSDLAAYDGYPHTDAAGDDKLHTGFSEPDLHMPEHGYPPAMHRIPPHLGLTACMTPEDPKYHAHRNSLNLQHPQPRSGQPFKAALERGAEDYDSPMSPRSADWAGSATSLHRFPGQNPHRYSGSSAAHEAQQQYWTASPSANQPSGPPRPPKEPLEESARTPPKSNRVSKLQKSSPLPYHSVESGYGTATHGAPTSYTGSPRLENRNLSGALGIPTRRPSGPRAMTPKSEKSMGSLNEGDSERRRKRDTFGTIASQESETF